MSTVMSAVNPLQYYTPKNALRFDCVENSQAHVSGGGGSTGPHGHIASVSTKSVITNYNISIKYEGPINIGERTIRSAQIPNYWRDLDTIEQARDNLDIHGDASCFCSCALNSLACISCGILYWCVAPFYNSHVENREVALAAEVKLLATDKMARGIADMLRASDTLVDQRIAEVQRKEQATPAAPAGMVTISVEQLQALTSATALLHQLQQSPAGAGVSGPALTTQYQQSPLTLAQQPSPSSGPVPSRSAPPPPRPMGMSG